MIREVCQDESRLASTKPRHGDGYGHGGHVTVSAIRLGRDTQMQMSETNFDVEGSKTCV